MFYNISKVFLVVRSNLCHSQLILSGDKGNTCCNVGPDCLSNFLKEGVNSLQAMVDRNSDALDRRVCLPVDNAKNACLFVSERKEKKVHLALLSFKI